MKNETVVGLSTLDKVLLILFPPIIGILIGWFIPVIADWATKVPFIPFEPAFEWIAGLESQWGSVIGVIIGLIAGVFFVFFAFSESLKIAISDKQVKLTFKEQETEINKSEISAIYMDGKDLVILDTAGKELYREPSESKKEAIAEAFNQHWYPFKDQDPFENQYYRWVMEHPDFPRHVNVLLSERERTLKNDEPKEAKVLRKDLANQGVVIRDEQQRQYVRMVRGEE